MSRNVRVTHTLGSTHLALHTWLYALGSGYAPGSMHLALCTWLYELGCAPGYALGSLHLALRDSALCNSLCVVTLHHLVQGPRTEEPFAMLLGMQASELPVYFKEVCKRAKHLRLAKSQLPQAYRRGSTFAWGPGIHFQSSRRFTLLWQWGRP